jgi:SagB-type dehydrogenase family enzyme
VARSAVSIGRCVLREPLDPHQPPGEYFQDATKYNIGRLRGGGLDWNSKPEPFKVYESPLAVVELPAPDLSATAPIWPSIARRRSERRYSAKPLSLQELSQLLWASQGVTARSQGYLFRAAPSAGALYPIETYLVVNGVTGLRKGAYHYRVPDHKLDFIREGDLGEALSAAALDQRMCASAGVVFVWTAVIQRSRWKYSQRAYRYIYLDAGHIAAHVSLSAVALGLGTCQIGAFYDDEVNRVVQVDGKEEFAVYMTTVGHVGG